MKDKAIDINEVYFATIESEDEEGNIIYGNVRKLKCVESVELETK